VFAHVLAAKPTAFVHAFDDATEMKALLLAAFDHAHAKPYAVLTARVEAMLEGETSSTDDVVIILTFRYPPLGTDWLIDTVLAFVVFP
jgi:hypothetical protein